MLHVAIALGLINVWIFRFNKATMYRGAGAQTMKQEFAAYGLPEWSVYVVGFLKILIATVLLLMVVVPGMLYLVDIAALGVLGILMIGAIYMHMKVRDSVLRILPAASILSMALLVLYMRYIG